MAKNNNIDDWQDINDWQDVEIDDWQDVEIDDAKNDGGRSDKPILADSSKIEGLKEQDEALSDFVSSIDPMGIGSKAGTYVAAGLEKASQLFGDGVIPGDQSFFEAQEFFDQQNQKDKKDRSDRSPVASLAGQLAGDAIVPLPGSTAKGVAGAGIRVGSGSIMGGVDAATHSNAEGLEYAQDVGMGLGLGALAGVGGEALGKGIESGSKFLKNKAAPYLKNTAEEKAVEALNPILSQQERLEASKNLNEVGRDLLDEGIVTPLASARKMADRLESTTENLGEDIHRNLAAIDRELRQGNTKKAIDGLTDNAAGIDAIQSTHNSLIDPNEIIESVLARIEPYKDSPAYRKGIAKVYKELEAILEVKPMTLVEANQLKGQYGDVIKSWGLADAPIEKKFMEELYRGIRDTIDNKISTLKGGRRLEELKEFQKVYSNLEAAEKIAKKSASRESRNNDFGINSYIMAGGVGAATGGVPGMAVGLLGREMVRKYGNQTLAVLADKLSKTLTNPNQINKLGKFGDILRKAAKESNKSLVATHLILMQNYPEYQQSFQQLEQE